MIKIEAFRFFSQKSTNCPIDRSSLFEPCLNDCCFNINILSFDDSMYRVILYLRNSKYQPIITPPTYGNAS